MAGHGRRPREVRRHAFSLRQLTLCFGLIAIVLFGAGIMAREAARAAESRPVAALVLGSAALSAAVALRHRRRSGTARRAVRPAPYDVPDAAAEGAREGDCCPPPAAGPEPVLAEPEPVLAEVDYAALDADEFEQAVADLCERDGCRDVRVVGGAGDLGADVVAVTQDGRRVVIQCKRYDTTHKVGSQDVQRFGGTCFAVHGAEVAAVVTTSGFTEPAVEYAAQCGIGCVDGQALADWASGTGPGPWAR